MFLCNEFRQLPVAASASRASKERVIPSEARNLSLLLLHYENHPSNDRNRSSIFCNSILCPFNASSICLITGTGARSRKT